MEEKQYSDLEQKLNIVKRIPTSIMITLLISAPRINTLVEQTICKMSRQNQGYEEEQREKTDEIYVNDPFNRQASLVEFPLPTSPHEEVQSPQADECRVAMQEEIKTLKNIEYETQSILHKKQIPLVHDVYRLLNRMKKGKLLYKASLVTTRTH